MNARRYPSVVTLACVLLIALLPTGCDLLGSADESGNHTVEMHLQTGFGGERVLVQIDEQVVFDDTLPREEPFSGPVHTIVVEERAGRHRIQVDIDGLKHEETTFTLDSKLYIGVQNTPAAIVFVIQKTPLGYL